MASESSQNVSNAILHESDPLSLTSDTPKPESDPPPSTTPAITEADGKWPGWPGDNVFRMIVPVLNVGCIIGYKGELIKKMCQETRARIRIIHGGIGSSDRIVLIYAKEEPEAQLSPAMVAVLRIFKRVVGLSEKTEGDGNDGVASPMCSIRLLVGESQAIDLIGRKGSVMKSIQASSGASIRCLSRDEVPFYVTPEERIIELEGESFKVLKALEAVLGTLRKFLVDHSVIPLFEKRGNETQSVLPTASSGLGRAAPPVVTQIIKIPFTHAKDIIGIGGAHVDYIRCTSRATVSFPDDPELPDGFLMEMKGTSFQVQTAEQLIHEFFNGQQVPVTSHGDTRLSSSLAPPPLGRYGSSSARGYGNFRI